jgi:hypothetical protein
MSEEGLGEILGDIEQSILDFTGAEAVLAEAAARPSAGDGPCEVHPPRAQG